MSSTTTSRMLLKHNHGRHKFLNWIGETLGGSMETRAARVTWEMGSDKGRIKSQVGLMGRSSSTMISKMTFPGLTVVDNRRNTFHKMNFSQEESKSILVDILKNSWHGKSGFIRTAPELAKDKVIVEFGSPNIAKPLHMGHLRSLVTGHFCARICQAAGHDVTTICFLGDWGTQFGILQAGLAKYLPENDNVLSTVDKLTLDELLRYYVQAVQENETNPEFSSAAMKLSSSLEQGDADCLRVWESIRTKTINHLKSFWSLLDVKYDVIQGESEFNMQNSLTEEALKDLTALGITEIAEDQCVYAVLPADSKFAKPAKIPLVKNDGSSLYLLRDIACAIYRKRTFDFNRMIYVVDKTQAHHFINLFRILEELKIQKNKYSEDGWDKKLWHVTFGKVEGQSTRSGNFVLLSDVINTGSSIMQENRIKSPNVRNIEDLQLPTQLAISALIVNSLKVRRNRDVAFDWNEALNPTGDTGVNLQYTHARLVSLEKNVTQNRGTLTVLASFDTFDIDQLIEDPIAMNLIIQLVNFEDAFWSSYSELEPCILLTYLFKLSNKVSKALKHLKVMSEPDENLAGARLALFLLSKRILAVGLNTLGIRPLSEI